MLSQSSLLVLALAIWSCDAVDVLVNKQPTANLKNGECVAAGSANYGTVGAASAYDYFPDKFVTSAADLFSITYHKTYKVITQTQDSQKIVAYQCGTPKPDATELGFTPGASDLIVSVPVTKVAFSSSTYVAWIELLGEASTVKHYTSSMAYVSSTCLTAQYNAGTITDGAATETAIKAAIGDDTAGTDVALNSVTFAGVGSSLYRGMKLAETHEDEVLEVAEYLGMVSSVYNKEKEASDLYTEISERYICVKNNVATSLAGINKLVTDGWPISYAKPKVLWFSFTDDGSTSGWSVGSCPNYYCEAITDAGGQMIEMTGTTPSVTVWGSTSYFTDAELLAKAAQADFAIVTGGYGSTGWNAKTSTLNQIKAFTSDTVADPTVFDTQGMGNDWFESRIAEPDVLLEDITTAIWPAAWSASTIASHVPVWIKPVGVASKTKAACVPGAPLPLQADTCTVQTQESSLAIMAGVTDTNVAAGLSPSKIPTWALIIIAVSSFLALVFLCMCCSIKQANKRAVKMYQDLQNDQAQLALGKV